MTRDRHHEPIFRIPPSPEQWRDLVEEVKERIDDEQPKRTDGGVPSDRAARELRFIANELENRPDYEILGSELDVEDPDSGKELTEDAEMDDHEHD